MADLSAIEFIILQNNTEFQACQSQKLCLSPTRDIFACLLQSGTLNVTSLRSEKASNGFVLVAENLCRFCWCAGDKDGECWLVGHTTKGHLVLFSVDSSKLNVVCLSQIHGNTLTSIAKESVNDAIPPVVQWELLGAWDHVVCMRAGDHLLALNLHADHLPSLLSTVRLSGEDDDVCLQQEVVCVLHAHAQASLYSLKDGSLIATIDLPSKVSMEQVWRHELSSELTHLIITTRAGSLVVIDLNRYFWSNPTQFSTGARSISDLSSSGTNGSYPCSLAPSVDQSICDEDLVYRRSTTQRATPKLRGDPHWQAALDGMTRRQSHSDVQLHHWYHPGSACRRSVQSKPKPVTSGFKKQKKLKVSHLVSSQRLITEATMPPVLLQSNLQALCMNGASVLLWCRNDGLHNALVTYNVNTATIRVHSLPDSDGILLPNTPNFPPIIVSPGKLKLVAFDLEQAKVINQLMLYESASVADTLCRLNEWDRCSIPMHALESGLQHRQLDTVAFFLKSRENVFTPERMSAEMSPGSPQLNHLEVDQVHSAIRLLFKTIDEHSHDHQSKQFADQLMQITQDFLHRVLLRINQKLHRLNNNTQKNIVKGELRHSAYVISGYIRELRHRQVSLKRETSPEAALDHTDGEWGMAKSRTRHKELSESWHQMQIKDATLDAILQGEIPLLQTVMQRSAPKDVTFSSIVNYGLAGVLSMLQRNDINTAIQLLTNMGFCVWTKLGQIWRYTADRLLRDYLSKELSDEGHMTSEESDLLNFVHQLERLYPCPSFHLSRTLRLEEDTGTWEQTLDLQSILGQSGSATVVHALGEIGSGDAVNTETASYACVLLDWLLHWSPETRTSVLLEQLLQRKDPSLLEAVDSHTLWHHYISHDNWKQLHIWAQAQMSAETDPEHRPAWPYCIPLENNLLDAMETATPLTQGRIQDFLARHGMFAPSELENFPRLVSRLARVKSVISAPRLLESSSGRSSMTELSYHRSLIQYCIEQRLPQLLYFYLDFWKLCVGSHDLGDLGQGQNDIPYWVEMLLAFRCIPQDVYDPNAVFSASLANHAFLKNMAAVSIETMLEQPQVGSLMGTLVYAPDKLQELTTVASPQQQRLQEVLKPHLRLYQALFKTPDSSASMQQLSVYTLLQGNVAFDIGHLFAWQTSNSLRAQDNTGMPHFTQADLVTKFAYTVALRYPYYLQQGRPTFAFIAFLQEQLQAGAMTLATKHIAIACSHAQQMALRNFHESSITSAAVAFTEMLGQDTTRLRLNLQAANLLLQHAMATRTGDSDRKRTLEADLQREIAHLMISCVRRRMKYVPIAVSLLEKATRWQISKTNLKSCSMGAGQHWLLVVMFCRSYHMPMSPQFLLDCATADNWLTFLVFAQLHQFPKQQLEELLPAFPSSHLREHLHYVIQHVTFSEEVKKVKLSPSSAIKSRDVRAQLYSKIGLKRTKEIGESSSSESDEEAVAVDKAEDASVKSELVLPSEGLGRDIFGLLLACISSASPWRCLAAFAVRTQNPVLSVLAVCFDNACPVSCLCSWLLASAPDGAVDGVKEAFGELEMHLWSSADLCELSQMLVQSGASQTLLEAFSIFDHTSALIPFLKFQLSFNNRSPQEGECQSHLEEFKLRYHQLHRKQTTEGDNGGRLLQLALVENIITAILWHLLETVSSSFGMGQLLRLLDQSSITRRFQCQVPDFGLLSRLHQATSDTGVELDYTTLAVVERDPDQHRAECERVIAELIQHEKFNDARLVSELVQISSHHITLTQLSHDLNHHRASGVWSIPAARCRFWLECHETLQRHRLPCQKCSEFFQQQVPDCDSHIEKGLVCKLAYDWQIQTKPANQELENKLFVEIWRSRIAMHMEKKKVEYLDEQYGPWLDSTMSHMVGLDSLSPAPRSQLLECSIGFDPAETPKVALSSQEKRTLDFLLGELLNSGHMKQACRVAALFGHYCPDLDIVVTCSILAQGRLPPNQLSLHLKKRLSMAKGPRRRLSTPTNMPTPRRARALSVTSIHRSQDEEAEPDIIMATMEQLQPLCKHSSPCCHRIIINYNIAKALRKEFDLILCEEEFAVLHEILLSKHNQRYAHAKAFISSSGLTTAKIADFLSSAIVDSLQFTANEAIQDSGPVPAMTHDTDNSSLGELSQLCDDPALLGQKLLAACNNLSSTENEHAIGLWLQVELLVQSHDCFTLACNLEGIAAVLRAARLLADRLQQHSQYKLMIGLLTGVGRFSEMKYIFDILKQEEQFELLLKKGNCKEESLRLALLDYLQQCHPNDSETYTMVALHFTMYREIAAMCEQRAHKNLRRLQDRPLENSSEMVGALQSIIHYFSDAAESYVKEKCLRHAENCVRHARLIALQSQLLSQGTKTQVINLNKAQAIHFIQNHHKFYEAYIVEDVYRVGSAWPGAVFNRFVLQSDTKYLADFQNYIKMTPSLIGEVADRFKLQQQKPKHAAPNMKKLLILCTEMKTTYKLANDLGFTEFKRDLLKGGTAAFLRDTVAM